MKVAIIGANGQLGTDLCKALRNVDVIRLTHADIEITDLTSVRETCQRLQPDIIINTAAYVPVDNCEDNRDKAFLVNALGARNVAVVVQELGAKLVHISTDYVFGGNPPNQVIVSEAMSSPDPTFKQSPHNLVSQSVSGYTEFDPPSPINVYGHSKLAGEDFVRRLCSRYFIVRGSGLFGVAGSRGKGGNFVETMIRLGKERDELRVVNDQVFSPTYTKDLANKIAQLISTEYHGIFHVTNSGACSWYDFTKEIMRLASFPTKVIPITSAQYPQKAMRPTYSVLEHFHLRFLGMDDIRSWQSALKDYMEEKKYVQRIIEDAY
jgi:dTDP-4-dehydrorhamnose reductase